MIYHCLQVEHEDWARELEAWEVEWGILSFGQEFYQAGCVQLSNQVVENHFEIYPTPCKTQENQHRGQLHSACIECSCQKQKI